MRPNRTAGEATGMTLHRAAHAFLSRSRAGMSSMSIAGLAEHIRHDGGLATLREDGSHLHPMGLRVTSDAAGGSAYMSACAVDGHLMTSVILSERHLPSTLLASAPGRRLEDVVSIERLPGDLMIRAMSDNPSLGTVIVLEDDDVEMNGAAPCGDHRGD